MVYVDRGAHCNYCHVVAKCIFSFCVLSVYFLCTLCHVLWVWLFNIFVVFIVDRVIVHGTSQHLIDHMMYQMISLRVSTHHPLLIHSPWQTPGGPDVGTYDACSPFCPCVRIFGLICRCSVMHLHFPSWASSTSALLYTLKLSPNSWTSVTWAEATAFYFRTEFSESESEDNVEHCSSTMIIVTFQKLLRTLMWQFRLEHEIAVISVFWNTRTSFILFNKIQKLVKWTQFRCVIIYSV